MHSCTISYWSYSLFSPLVLAPSQTERPSPSAPASDCPPDSPFFQARPDQHGHSCVRGRPTARRHLPRDPGRLQPLRPRVQHLGGAQPARLRFRGELSCFFRREASHDGPPPSLPPSTSPPSALHRGRTATPVRLWWSEQHGGLSVAICVSSVSNVYYTYLHVYSPHDCRASPRLGRLWCRRRPLRLVALYDVVCVSYGSSLLL